MSRSCQVSEHTLHVYVLKWKFLSLIEEMKNSKISIVVIVMSPSMFSSSNGVYYVLIYLSIYLCVWISVHCSLTNFRIKMVAWNDCLHSVFVSDKRLKTLVFGQKLCEITTTSFSGILHIKCYSSKKII